jgi:hypothetical protein
MPLENPALLLFMLETSFLLQLSFQISDRISETWLTESIKGVKVTWIYCIMADFSSFELKAVGAIQALCCEMEIRCYYVKLSTYSML